MQRVRVKAAVRSPHPVRVQAAPAVPSPSPRPRPRSTSALSPETQLQRARLLGHRPPVAVQPRGEASIQRMVFYNWERKPYDPEILGLPALRTKLWEWQQDLQTPFPQRWSGLPDHVIQNRISQLESLIEQTEDRGGAPRKAKIGKNFEDKHLIRGDQVDAAALKDSIQRSITFNRWLNTVVHLQPVEVDQVQVLAMRALAQAGYPSTMVPFQVTVGVVTQFDETKPDQVGVYGNFSIHRNTEVTLGVMWNANTEEGLIMHLEKVRSWPAYSNYNHSAFGGHARLSKLFGDGPFTINL